MNFNRKYIILAGVVIAVLAGVYIGYPFFGRLVSMDDEIYVKEKQLKKYRTKLKEKEDLEKKYDQLKKILEKKESGLFSDNTAALAAANIQNLVNEMAVQSEVEIRSMQVQQPESETGTPYVAIPVQVAFISDIKRLKTFLYRIENSEKILKVTDLEVTYRRGRSSDQVNTLMTVVGGMPQKPESRAKENT